MRSNWRTFLDWLAERFYGTIGIIAASGVTAALLLFLRPRNMSVWVGAAALAIVVAAISASATRAKSAVLPGRHPYGLVARIGASAALLAVSVAVALGYRGAYIDAIGAVAAIAGVYVLMARTTLPRHGYTQPSGFQEQRISGSEGEILRRVYGDPGRYVDRILEACTKAVNRSDLHLVAYYVDGKCVFLVDVLDDPGLLYLTDVGADWRRNFYHAHGSTTGQLVAAVNGGLRSVDSGILLRMVLDVERGAMYYFYVDEYRYLIGATLDQVVVHKADAKMVHLVDECRALLGHKRIEDLSR